MFAKLAEINGYQPVQFTTDSLAVICLFSFGSMASIWELKASKIAASCMESLLMVSSMLCLNFAVVKGQAAMAMGLS